MLEDVNGIVLPNDEPIKKFGNQAVTKVITDNETASDGQNQRRPFDCAQGGREARSGCGIGIPGSLRVARQAEAAVATRGATGNDGQGAMQLDSEDASR